MSADRGGGRRATLAAWQDIERHFEAVVLLAEEERRAYLERECGGDADLEAAVQELLDADAKAPTFFEQGARSTSPPERWTIDPRATPKIDPRSPATSRRWAAIGCSKRSAAAA